MRRDLSGTTLNLRALREVESSRVKEALVTGECLAPNPNGEVIFN